MVLRLAEQREGKNEVMWCLLSRGAGLPLNLFLSWVLWFVLLKTQLTERRRRVLKRREGASGRGQSPQQSDRWEGQLVSRSLRPGCTALSQTKQ